ncbi:Spy/CpxP family protein refolding chaperone [Hoeflea poritis]|uniref:Periplasmic heavy metal sensor n=1 Tax=Hoeflea poritis TaxID=2993659 RepID=A0ABT4VJR9_9HYPH|nr:periplasmic heavy metal sensor [Hoeflea poritis]MDA4844900.1 periplasmic heavy metal sensor [Hoeflea poritis]
MSNEQQNPNSGRFTKGNRLAIALIAGAGIAAGGIFTVQAVADSKTYQHVRMLTSDGGAEFTKAAWGGHRRRGPNFSEMSDTEIEKHITRAVKHLAIEIDATEQQQEQIVALVLPAAINMKTLRGEMRGTGQEFAELLTSPTVDRAAIEELRAEKLAEADQISKEWVNVVTDVSMVLTAEQRDTIKERLDQFRSMRGGWRH